MAEKYTERGIVLLKRETEELSATVHSIIEEIASKKKEITEWEERLTEKKRIFHGYDSLVASHFEKLKQDEKSLIETLQSLKNEAKTHLKTLSVLRGEIHAIEVPEPNFNFAEEVAALLSKRISGLDETYRSKKDQVSVVKESYEQTAQELVDLRSEKEILEPKLEHLRSEIYLGNDKNGRMGLEYLRLEDAIANIKVRERNLDAMEKKLIPMYRELSKQSVVT